MQRNTQPPEPLVTRQDDELEVHSIFRTTQGEGPYAGTPAVFIRLAGCNLQCPACDTDYTSKRATLSPAAIVAQARTLMQAKPRTELPLCYTESRLPLVVVTGGEPFRQPLGEAVRALYHAGFRIQIETNGILCPTDFPFTLATIVCSPKASVIHAALMPHIAALKYIITAGRVDPDDGLPTETMLAVNRRVARPNNAFRGEVYVQPLDESGNATGGAFWLNEANVAHREAAMASADKFGYRLCLQLHKLLNLE